MRARQKVSRAGVELIKSFEGLRQTAARLPDGRWTLGYGHTFSAREGARVTQEDADALLRFDLLPIVDSLNNMILVPLNQNQFDALVSFSFNIGIENFGSSSVLKRINEGRMTEAALAMDAWRSAEFNGQTYVLAPLIRRRAAEKNLFLTPEDTVGNAPSLLVRPLADVEADAASARPSEVDAPDRGGILSAYPAGEPQAAAQPARYGFTPAPPPSAPIQPEAPVRQESHAFQPAAVAPVLPAEVLPVDPRPAPPQSPYAASSYAAETPVAPGLPLSPYAGTYTPPVAPQPVTFEPAPSQPVVAPAPQSSPYERQFIDLASVTSPSLPDAAPVHAPIPELALQPAAPVLQPSDISPYPPMISPYAPVAPQAPPIQPFTPQPAAPQPLAPTAFQPPVEPPLVEMLPGGYAAPSQIRETPVAEPAAPTAFDSAFGAAVMSPEVAAALARAQDEQRQREEAERLAQQAAARAAEEVRIRELQRQEAERLEQQRQEQDRIERARLDAERQERERVEQARLELQRQEFERQEFERQARDRAEQARVEQDRLEQARLEQERQDRERAEQVRIAQETAERERAEQARLEAERQARAEQARLEQQSLAASAAIAVAPAVDDAAEKARKAEAAAALMRLYSPYGGGPLGRPLNAPLVTPQPGASEASSPKPEAPQAAEPEPEAAKQPVEEITSQDVVTEAPVVPAAAVDDNGTPIFSTRVETRDDSDDDVSGFRPFTPIMSANNLPAPIVTAMNPYASPLPQTAVREATDEVIEVPRPQPIVTEAVAAEAIERVSAPAGEGLHWRERLQRPLPDDHQPAAPDVSRPPERPTGPLSRAAFAGDYDDARADAHGGEAWIHDGRIAMSSEEGEVHHVSWIGMFLSTIWWILLSIVGIISLGVAAGAYYKSKDLSVIRDGLQPDLEAVSIVTAVIGLVLVSLSMWLMMRRLGGLKE